TSLTTSLCTCIPRAMVVSISQPRYLPWLGYFSRIVASDLFVYLDHVQYTPRDWENRNRVKGPNGPTWPTGPVNAKNRARLPDVRIDNTQPWWDKHWKSLETFYARAPYFDAYAGGYRRLLREQRWETLIDLNLAVTRQLADDLGMPPVKYLRSS